MAIRVALLAAGTVAAVELVKSSSRMDLSPDLYATVMPTCAETWAPCNGQMAHDDTGCCVACPEHLTYNPEQGDGFGSCHCKDGEVDVWGGGGRWQTCRLATEPMTCGPNEKPSADGTWCECQGFHSYDVHSYDGTCTECPAAAPFNPAMMDCECPGESWFDHDQGVCVDHPAPAAYAGSDAMPR